MILPGSQALALSILILCMVCWGLWPSTYKMTGKWRFELFYIDFAVGIGLASLIAALTFGSMGWDGFSVMDDLRLAGKRHDMYAFVAGAVFNLGNMLLVASISLAGIGYALPMSMGTALVVGSGVAFAGKRQGSPIMVIGGCILMLIAVAFSVIAYKDVLRARLAVAPEPGKKAPKKTLSYKGIVTGILGGIMLGLFVPLLFAAGEGEDSLGPYSSAFIFAIGVFVTTIILDLFFMNLPIQGRPVEMGEYFSGRAKQHFTGMLGGILWMVGLLSVLVVARADAPVRPTPLLQFLVPQVGPLIAICIGLFVWKELAAGAGRARTYTAAMLLVYVLGLGVLSAAPFFSK